MTAIAARLSCGALLCLAAACARTPVAVRAPQPELPVIRCGAAHDADFAGAGEEQLRRFLDWLAQTYGADVSLRPQDVSLAIVRGPAKPGPMGVTAAEVACDVGSYRIILYRDALSGRPLPVAYDTLAHEFFHIFQIRRDGLSCESRKGERARYEREAVSFATGIVPACRREGPARPR